MLVGLTTAIITTTTTTIRTTATNTKTTFLGCDSIDLNLVLDQIGKYSQDVIRVKRYPSGHSTCVHSVTVLMIMGLNHLQPQEEGMPTCPVPGMLYNFGMTEIDLGINILGAVYLAISVNDKSGKLWRHISKGWSLCGTFRRTKYCQNTQRQ